MFTTVFRPQASQPGPADDFWYQAVSPQTASGVRVDHDRALRLNAFLACVRVIAESLASLPWILYRDRADGGKDRATDHPMYLRFKKHPNQWQTRFEFVEMMQGHLLLRGNAFAEIVPVGGGAADLIPLNPDRMMVEQLTNGRLRYTYRELRTDGTMRDRTLSQDQVFHIRGLSVDGLLGLDSVEYSKDTIGTALATELYTGKFFANAATPSGILVHPTRLDEKGQKNLERSIDRHRQGGAHRVMVLEEGMKWQQLGINAEDAQLIEARKMGVEDIARSMRVPLHMIQMLDKATFSNIEQQSIDFVTHTIRPWAVRWELAAQRDIVDDDDLFTEFLLDALLRADLKTRYEAYSIGIASTFLSPDEARAKENMNPRDDGAGGVFQNPNTTPGDEEGGLEETDDDEQAGWIGVMIDAIAARIATREQRAISGRLKHADNDRAMFNEWASEWYNAHGDYVESELKPLSVALATANRTLDSASVADQHTGASAAEVTSADLEPWIAGQASRLSALILSAIEEN